MESIRLNMSLLRDMNNGKKPIKSEYAVFCAVAIYKNYKDGVDYNFTPKILYNLMLNKEANARVKDTTIKGIKDGLEELQSKNWIDYKVSGNTYIVTSARLFTPKDNDKYFTTPLSYINKVVIQRGGISLLKHYLYLLSTINLGTRVGFNSRETISENLGVASLKTITQRNKKLEELGVICFKERKGKDANNNFINMTNVYYLPEDASGNNVEGYIEDTILDRTKEINKGIAKERKEKIVGFKKQSEPKQADYYGSWNGTDTPF